MSVTEKKHDIKHFIFDFDGTISDSYPVFTDMIEKMLKDHGMSDTRENIYSLLKISATHALKHYDWGEEYTYEQIAAEYRRNHVEMCMRQKAFPDAKQMLTDLRKAGYKTYIYTHTGKIVYEIIENMGLTGLFDFVLDQSYHFPSKPDPSALNFLLDKFSIPRENAMMVGDRDIDILAGRNAGIIGCFYDPEGYYPDFKAEYNVDTLSEISEIFVGK